MRVERSAGQAIITSSVQILPPVVYCDLTTKFKRLNAVIFLVKKHVAGRKYAILSHFPMKLFEVLSQKIMPPFS